MKLKTFFSSLVIVLLLWTNAFAVSYSTIQMRRATAASWASTNPIPAQGEPCFETDTNKMKVGNGTSHYNSLAYLPPATTPGVTYPYPYEIDALAVYGGGTSFTQATIEDAIGTTNKVTLLLRPGNWVILTALAFPANVTVKMPAGAYFSGAAVTAGTVTFASGSQVTPDMFGVNISPGITDMTAAVKAAIAASPNVVIPDGATYLISTNLSLATGTNISGRGTIKMAATSVYDGLSSTGKSNITVKDITIDMNKANQTDETTKATNFIASSDITVEGVTVKNAFYGIGTSDSYRVSIKNNIIYDCKFRGIIVSKSTDAAHPSYGIEISGNKIWNVYSTLTPGAAVDGIGILLNGDNATPLWVEDVTIANNILGNNIGNYGICTIAGKRVSIVGNTTRNILLNTSTASSINVSAASKEVVVDGNTCADGYQGIQLDVDDGYGSSAYGQIVVSNNIVTGNNSSGIKNQNADNVVVSGNHISGGAYGILFANTFGASKIVNNTTQGQSSNGIRVANPDANISNMLISGNTIYDQTGTDATMGGMYLEGISESIISDNVFHTNAGGDLITNADTVNLELRGNRWASVSISSGSNVKYWDDANFPTTFLSAEFGGNLATHIVVAAGFTLKTFGRSVWRIGSASAVTSNTTTAIANGYIGQRLMLLNDNGADTITIKDAANTSNIGSADIVLAAGEAVEFVYTSLGWSQVSVKTAH